MRAVSCALLLVGFILQQSAEACTTVLVTAGASATGVPMVLHTLDCWDCDTRIGLVPSKDHPEGATHDVFGIGHLYPYVTTEDSRAWIYQPQPELVSCLRKGGCSNRCRCESFSRTSLELNAVQSRRMISGLEIHCNRQSRRC